MNKIYDNELEEAVLGTFLIYSDSLFRVADVLPEDAFFDPINNYIYSCILSMSERTKIDLLTVTHECMEKKGVLEDRYKDINLPYVLSNLTSRIASDVHLEAHVDILLRFRTKRKLYEMGGKIRTSIDQGDELDDIINDSADMFVDATTNKQNTEVGVAQGLKEFVENQERDVTEKLIPTYLPEVDDVIGGFEYSDLIIIAGAPSMGKTSFMLRLLQNYLHQKKSMAIFSLEMSNNQLLTRLISMDTGVPIKNIRYNNLDTTDWEKIHTCIAKYEVTDFVMDGQTSKLQDVLNKIKKLKIRDNIDVVFIDYLQLIVADGKGKGSREQEVAKIARSLKNIAKELNIVVVALSQISRALTMRDNKRPMLSDLRESGEIEQAADTIMFCFREEYYSMENPREIQDAEIIVAKGRNVGIGVAHLKFQPANAKFISPRTDEYTQQAQPWAPISSPPVTDALF